MWSDGWQAELRLAGTLAPPATLKVLTASFNPIAFVSGISKQ